MATIEHGHLYYIMISVDMENISHQIDLIYDKHSICVYSSMVCGVELCTTFHLDLSWSFFV